MVVRAAQGDRETHTRRTFSLLTRFAAGTPTRTSETRGSFPKGKMQGRARASGLTWQCSGLQVRGVLVYRHRAAAAASRKELPRRGELTEHRIVNTGQPSGQGVRRPLRAPANSPTFLSGFTGLRRGGPGSSSILLGQMLSKTRRPAALLPHTCILCVSLEWRPAPLRSLRYPRLLAQKLVRGRGSRVAREEKREGGEEREDGCTGGVARA